MNRSGRINGHGYVESSGCHHETGRCDEHTGCYDRDTLFEPGASFVMKPGVVVSGIAGIRQALEGFMALKPTLTIDAQQLVEAGEVAQYCAR